ncbi:MAG: hypothetical protein AAF512_21215, partial [Pseudomonadota bacterium]
AAIPIIGGIFGSLAGCNRAPLDIKTLPEDELYPMFLEVLMPSELERFAHLRSQVGEALRRLSGQDAIIVANFFQRFKNEFYGYHLDLYGYELLDLEEIFIRVMQDPRYSLNANLALDIIYLEISDIPDMGTAIWHRDYSISYHMCVYWDDYDQPIAEENKKA